MGEGEGEGDLTHRMKNTETSQPQVLAAGPAARQRRDDQQKSFEGANSHHQGYLCLAPFPRAPLQNMIPDLREQK